jgi:hypothetical protein
VGIICMVHSFRTWQYKECSKIKKLIILVYYTFIMSGVVAIVAYIGWA